MAPESERAMKCVGCGHPPHVGGECKTFVDIPLGMPYCECIADTPPNEPTLTCSEVVERLIAECVPPPFKPSINRAHAEKILDSWRERRVQELEECLRELRRTGSEISEYRQHLGGCEYNNTEFCTCGRRAAMVAFQEAVERTNKALANSEWREQIRKGAKHESA